MIVIDGKVLRKYDDSYYVGANGEIYSIMSKKYLKWTFDIDGYPRVDIHSKHIKVHQLVYKTWIGELPQGMQINHRDDNKLNPCYLNLYAGTQKENMSDCIKNKTRCGNIFLLKVFDKDAGTTISFCPASNFIEYSGHTNKNRSLQKVFNKKWFIKRYKIVEYRRVNSNFEIKSVTTMGDECNPVGREMHPLEAHRTQLSEEIV